MELIDRDVLFNSFNDCSCECGVCQYSLDGLPCGLIENAPTVEAIPKDQYEARLKADMVAMLEDLNLEIDEMFAREINYTVYKIQDLIQQKINKLKGNEMAMTIEELKEFHDNILAKEKWEVQKVRLFTRDEVEAMFTDLQLEIEELEPMYMDMIFPRQVNEVIQKKINALKADSEEKE